MRNVQAVKYANNASLQKVAALPENQLAPGHGPVAERIRIRSRHITEILRGIHGASLSSKHPQVVMIRPFRALLYYNEEIQQTFQKLEAAFGHSHQGMDGDQIVGDGGKVFGESERKRKWSKKNKGYHYYTWSPEAYRQMKVLVEFIDTVLLEKIKYLRNDDCPMVGFTDLWYLFEPGDEVIERSRRQAFRVLRVTSPMHRAIPPWREFEISQSNEETPMTITCVYIDFDGKQLGPVTKEFHFNPFNGEKSVTSLELYPLRFAKRSSRDEIYDISARAFRDMLIRRGKKFIDTARVKHMHYNGHTVGSGDEVDSHVVIDFEEAVSKPENNCTAATFETLIEYSGLETSDKLMCNAECCRNEHVHVDTYVEKQRAEAYIAGLIPQDKSTEPSVLISPRSLIDVKTMPDDDLVIMSYRVFGYVLRSRRWGKLCSSQDRLFHEYGPNTAINFMGVLQLMLHADLSSTETLDLQFLSEIGSRGKQLDQNDEEEEISAEARESGDDVMEQSGNETSFDQLVLPEGHKGMLKSLVAQHFRDKEASMAHAEQGDIVRGKGNMSIVILEEYVTNTA